MWQTWKNWHSRACKMAWFSPVCSSLEQDFSCAAGKFQWKRSKTLKYQLSQPFQETFWDMFGSLQSHLKVSEDFSSQLGDGPGGGALRWKALGFEACGFVQSFLRNQGISKKMGPFRGCLILGGMGFIDLKVVNIHESLLPAILMPFQRAFTHPQDGNPMHGS